MSTSLDERSSHQILTFGLTRWVCIVEFSINHLPSSKQVAVPERVAKVLTYPERVTEVNTERLRQAIRNGWDKHPGAAYVYSAGANVKRSLQHAKFNRADLADKLEIGDIVERHVIDGEFVWFPSYCEGAIMLTLDFQIALSCSIDNQVCISYLLCVIGSVIPFAPHPYGMLTLLWANRQKYDHGDPSALMSVFATLTMPILMVMK